ncbi:hypothetical protein JCM17960_04050 [Magnetospira thiophila]
MLDDGFALLDDTFFNGFLGQALGGLDVAHLDELLALTIVIRPNDQLLFAVFESGEPFAFEEDIITGPGLTVCLFPGIFFFEILAIHILRFFLFSHDTLHLSRMWYSQSITRPYHQGKPLITQ